MTIRRAAVTAALAILTVVAAPGRAAAGQSDIVVYTSDVTSVQGNWSKVSGSGVADGQYLSSADNGWSTTDAPIASPSHYFEASINAAAGTSYHIWLRLRATGNSKWNESVWVQFSDSLDQNGSAIYRIGTTSALLVNLENCSGCGVSSWGWQDRAYWLNQTRTVRFPSSGTRTIRVQTREDGVQIDQIVLSPSTYATTAPGQVAGDTTIVSKSSSSSSSSSGSSSSAFSGSPAPVPGTIEAEAFDNGAEGVAYHDTGSSTNAGGAYRQTGVDIESATEGSYDVGWTAGGEWLNYTVSVAASGTYTANFRVASAGQGGTFHLEMNGSNVTGAMTVPDTGGWQSWTTVSRSVSLNAGQQVARLVFDSAGSTGAIGNFTWLRFDSSSSGSGGGGGALTPYNGSPAAIPGTIRAETFDNGGEGVAYHDTGSTNAGGAVRQTGVDIESSSDGGYDVGWTASGEWLNYTVNVASSGSYTVQLRVASVGGANMHVGFNGGSNVWQAVSIPDTGGWQSWTTVSFTTTLSGGQQLMTVAFDSAGVNLNRVMVASGAAAAPSPSPSGSDVPVVHWNIQVNDSSTAHARAAMAVLASLNPQPRVIVLAEARQTQYSTYISELQSRTGLTWNGIFQSHCPPGAWNGSSCTGSEDEGVAVLSSLPIQSTSSMYFPYADSWHSARAAVRAAVNVNGVTLQVFGVHLIPNDATARYNSMTLLKNWASNQSRPQIVGGDFNADVDQIRSSSGMGTAFVDATLLVGSGNPMTALLPNLTMKLDYWFSDTGNKAQPQWAVVVNTGTVSDHLAIMASYRVSP